MTASGVTCFVEKGSNSRIYRPQSPYIVVLFSDNTHNTRTTAQLSLRARYASPIMSSNLSHAETGNCTVSYLTVLYREFTVSVEIV